MQPQSFDELSDQLMFINLDITCWSGKKRLTPEDLGLDRAQLPPETLVSLGDKQLIDPETLRAFTSVRSAARRQCLAVGTRFLGGYAIPAPKAQALLRQLDGLGQQYQAACTAFLANFDQQVADWAAQQPPEWQRLIRETALSAEAIGRKLRFAVQAVRFTAPDPAVVNHSGLSQALSGLGGQVLHEIAGVAREALEKSFQGKREVTRRALNPFRAIRDKLDGLSFLDSRFHAVIAEIDRLATDVTAQGPITGAPLTALRQFLCLAAQPDGLRTWAETVTPILLEGLGGGCAGASGAPSEPASLAATEEAEPARPVVSWVDVEDDPDPGAEECAPAPVVAAIEPAVSTADAGWFF
jgi:hypothetical protein